mgnify:CR=1 FL=1
MSEPRRRHVHHHRRTARQEVGIFERDRDALAVGDDAERAIPGYGFSYGGFHVAPATNQDNHCANWGKSYTNRTAVLIPTGTALSKAALVDALIALARQKGASDLHLEPGRDSLEVRLRVQGLAHMVRDLAGIAQAPRRVA